MKRRTLLIAAASILSIARKSALSQTTPAEFDREFRAYVADVPALEDAHAFREIEYRDKSLLEEQGAMKGPKSDRHISQGGIELIVASEVSSKSVYEAGLKHPTWPKGNSGVTIGIGYDLGFVNEIAFADHWAGLLPDATIETLANVCGKKGTDARDALASVQHISVEWNPAADQFARYLPYVIAETERAFPNCADLSDDSLGALVSLVYNRGSDTSDTPRRHEMHVIRELMIAKNFPRIPAQIRAMKHIWAGDPDARGLLVRRELEAKLFEEGLG
jgi:GH24 family phage-related lysozyme (muramidase)